MITSRISAFAMIVRSLAIVVIVSAGAMFLVSLGSAAEPPPQQQQVKPPAQPKVSPRQAVPPNRLTDEDVPPMTKEQVQKKTAELRKKYPFESLSKRLAFEDRFDAQSKDGPAPKLSEEAAKHLEALEVAGQPRLGFGSSMRTRALEMVHSDQVERFITREGFGLSRLPQPTVRSLELADTEPVSYPHFLLPSTETEETQFTSLQKLVKADDNPGQLPTRDMLFGFHLSGQSEFFSPLGLGLARDRDHVAGFKPHQFRHGMQFVSKWDRERARPGEPQPAPTESWVVRRLELISLLKHEKPAVYVSAHLPKLDELDEAETRAPTEFETDSLKSLRAGESLVARAKTNHLEMLGALRAGKQCQQCHQVQRGELLGAFSYELHRSPEIRTGKTTTSGGG